MAISNENDFKCEICMESFNTTNRRPNSLVPCGHTFCIICLEHIGNSKCPTCRYNILFLLFYFDLLFYLKRESYMY